jgi:hypothetical protein
MQIPQRGRLRHIGIGASVFRNRAVKKVARREGARTAQTESPPRGGPKSDEMF